MKIPFISASYCVCSCDGENMSLISGLNCLMNTLTYNKNNEGVLFSWESACVTSVVVHLCVEDFYGGIAVLQFILKVKNSSSELLVLTCAAMIVMQTSIVEENLLVTIFLPVKHHVLNVLLGAEGTGQNCVSPFFHGHSDATQSWKTKHQMFSCHLSSSEAAVYNQFS